jgi:effector-binding domain-containing protein
MRYEVQIREVGPQPLAAARGQGNAENYVSHLFALLDEVWRFLKANPQPEPPGQNVFLYWNEGDKDLLHSDAGLPLEAGVQVAAPFEGTGKVVCSATPGGTVATVAHLGPYEKLAEAHAALRRWCKDHNRPLAGPSWEIYGDWNDDPAKLRTDVFYLLQETAVGSADPLAGPA